MHSLSCILPSRQQPDNPPKPVPLVERLPGGVTHSRHVLAQAELVMRLTRRVRSETICLSCSCSLNPCSVKDSNQQKGTWSCGAWLYDLATSFTLIFRDCFECRSIFRSLGKWLGLYCSAVGHCLKLNSGSQ